MLVVALELEKDLKNRWWLAAGLCVAAEKLTADDAAQVCEPAAVDMAEAIATRKLSADLEYNGYLLGGFTRAMSRIASSRADQAAGVLAAAFEREKDVGALSRLATALESAASRLALKQA